MARAAAAKKPQQDKIEIFTDEDVPQGSAEWHELRRGIPTASCFHLVMASGRDGGDSKGRAQYLRTLAGEILTGEVASETYRNAAMDRGKEMEPEACEHFARMNLADLEPVGFVRRTVMPVGIGSVAFVVGASPDRFIGKDAILETKTMRPDLLIEAWQKGAAGFPSQHRAQCQGLLWVTGREVCKLMLFYRGMPITPTFTVVRDEAYIRLLREQCEIFDHELRQLVGKIRGER